MNEVFFLVEEAIEGGYTAKALGESIFTEGETLEELRTNIKEAVQCHFEDDNLPKIIRLHLVKEEVLTL
ncbi:MAG: type II toxin-antitoxin system HicB family antitoxin [Janthinobacterium lividum]